MTRTSHGHYIPETPKDNKFVIRKHCGGIKRCDECTFQANWVKDFAEKKAIIFPSEVESLDSAILKKVAAKIRERHPKPRHSMLIPDYQIAVAIYTLADALDGVAKDLSGS
jgi:hypothetical protein